ncbi:MAG: alpha/beta hydrolase [Roseovarius sp.]
MTRGSEASPREMRWEIDGLSLAGLAWGPESGTPVLALHGWMDHAASFAELAPRLTGCRVVALDLSGQGLSGHRAAHASYNIWDDLPQIAGLLDVLGWPDCVLLGHSRGANIAGLFAAAQPHRVRALVALDSLVPEPVPEEAVIETLRAFIEEGRARQAASPRVYDAPEGYIARRMRQGNARAVAEALSERALEPSPGGFRLRGDARHFASSAVKLTRGQVEAVLRALRCPVLNIWASEGVRHSRRMPGDPAQLGHALVADYTSLEIAGDHHFHMEPRAAGEIASAIEAFLARLG